MFFRGGIEWVQFQFQSHTLMCMLVAASIPMWLQVLMMGAMYTTLGNKHASIYLSAFFTKMSRVYAHHFHAKVL